MLSPIKLPLNLHYLLTVGDSDIFTACCLDVDFTVTSSQREWAIRRVNMAMTDIIQHAVRYSGCQHSISLAHLAASPKERWNRFASADQQEECELLIPVSPNRIVKAHITTAIVSRAIPFQHYLTISGSGR